MIPQSVIQLSENFKVLPIPDYDGYFATEDGRIISLHRNRWGLDESSARLLTIQKLKNGYSGVFLSSHGKSTLCYVHRLVILTFVGVAPEGKSLCCHNDGNKQNNHLSNLRWDNHNGNQKDTLIHGTYTPPPKSLVNGSLNGQSKLTEDQVIEIRRLLNETDLTQVQIAELFQISDRTVGDIKRGKSWAWLK